MKLFYWQPLAIGVGLFLFSWIDRVEPLNSSVSSAANPLPQSIAQLQACNSSLKVAATPNGENLIVRDVPNGGLTATCFENGTSLKITQYSIDEQWAFVEAQWTEGNWQPVGGWVKTQYLACSQ